jgi:hypothetical protein
MSLWPGRSDRLGRSLQDLIAFLSDLHALKVDLFLKSQGIDTTKSSPRARRHAASKDLDPGFSARSSAANSFTPLVVPIHIRRPRPRQFLQVL